MKVTVKLFAAAKEIVGADEIVTELPPGASFGDLRRKLSADNPQLQIVCVRALFAADARYVGDEDTVPSDCEIAMIPPVSGG